MTSNFSHLINIVFRSLGSQKTVNEIKKVDQALINWDTKKHETALQSLKSRGLKPVGDTAKDAGENLNKAGSKMNDFTKAMRRAIIVAPVWLAIRTAMMALIRGISEGFKTMEDFNRALMKAKPVIHGITIDINTALKDLSGRVRELSEATGESLDKITSSFYRFGTVGTEFEEAWRGATASVRFAIATMGDADQTARTMALTFNLLGKTVDETIPPAQRHEVQMAKLYKLWRINAFEADQLTESLRQFLPTANTTNLTMDQTIALLASLNSAALQSSRGGRLLRTSMTKLIENSDKLAGSLGIYVNPQLDTTFTLFMKVLGAVKKLGETQTLPLAAQEVISNIFGGIRGGEPVKALVALYDSLNENIGITSTQYGKLGDTMKEYNDRQKEVTESASRQLQIFRNLRTQVFEQFITGTLGAEDFAKALQKINSGMLSIINSASDLGKELNKIGKEPWRLGPMGQLAGFVLDKRRVRQQLIDQIDKALKGELTLLETIKLKTEIEMKFPKDRKFREIADNLQQIANNIAQETAKKAPVEIPIDIIAETVTKGNKMLADQDAIHANILRKLELEKEEMLTQLAIQNLQDKGYSKADISLAKIVLEIQTIVREYNSLDAIQEGVVDSLSEQQVISLALKEQWSDLLLLMNNQPGLQERILALSKKINAIELDRQKILKKQKDEFIGLYVQYEKAGEVERNRIRRLLELKNLSAFDLVGKFQQDAYDKDLILDYWNSFSNEAQTAIGNIIQQMNRLPTTARPLATTTTAGALLPNLQTTGTPKVATKLSATTNIDKIILNISGEEFELLPQNIAQQITEKLQNNPDFRKLWAGILGKEI